MVSPQFTPSPLTPRERQIAGLIAQGLSNTQIAQRLVLAPGTVANHVAHILQKLGVQSRVQIAVSVAVQNSSHGSERIFGLLQRLREVGSANFEQALQHATDLLADTFAADKVDAFIYDPRRGKLVAAGTSRTPMGAREHALGLNELPIARGGRVAQIFRDDRPHLDGHVEQDSLELPEVYRELGVRSMVGVPLEVRNSTRGVLVVASATPEYFDSDDLALLQFVANWVGLVARERGAIGPRSHPAPDQGPTALGSTTVVCARSNLTC